MRKWLYETITGDAALMTLIGGSAKVFSAGSVNLPEATDMVPPFIVIRALPSTEALAGAGSKVARLPYWIWIHDEQGSFENVIGAGLDRLRAVLPRDLPVVRPEGTLIECRWEGDSGDQFDDGFKTATRYGSYRITARR